nr:hypothetical protein BSM_06140 [uncultured archaeon]
MQNTQNIYIDTCFFQGYLWGKSDEKENAKDILSKIESNVRNNPEINVKIPFIVVGELINNLIRENFEQGVREEIMYKFFERLKELKADIIPPNKCCYAKAKLLIDRDRYLVEHAPTDTLIVSCALCDMDSAFLLTEDSLLLVSYSLKEIERAMREAGKRNRQLKITNEF